MRAHQGVHRVDLQHAKFADLRQHLAVTDLVRQRATEALGTQRQAPGLGEGQDLRRSHSLCTFIQPPPQPVYPQARTSGEN
ncbi:hypothetical protein D3C80_2081070 [compost metagenome]